MSLPPTLDLSYNKLSGSILPEFGNLKMLRYLDLKFNNLSGPIPSTLAGLRNLEALDFSHNKLSGTIPSSLESLSFLSKFNVAYNQLHGKIPSRGQFSSFPSSSFVGNIDLCGDYTNIICTKSNIPREATHQSHRDESFTNGIIVGGAFGFVFVFGASLFPEILRYAGPMKRLRTHKLSINPT
ncbi:hypothetical protein CsatB_027300 [Cannabis sativa]|uniref:Uncharacterized protein n=1 Tax=Cannabis sativa TaxID=3483 RepID=A0A7J6GAH0_CANSA|nr:hypothetical protein F8388_001506 [Cannabis sativa]KAF4379924.1 hypothetical protein G4B88_029916 [Cannabis sativa]